MSKKEELKEVVVEEPKEEIKEVPKEVIPEEYDKMSEAPIRIQDKNVPVLVTYILDLVNSIQEMKLKDVLFNMKIVPFDENVPQNTIKFSTVVGPFIPAGINLEELLECIQIDENHLFAINFEGRYYLEHIFIKTSYEPRFLHEIASVVLSSLNNLKDNLIYNFDLQLNDDGKFILPLGE